MKDERVDAAGYRLTNSTQDESDFPGIRASFLALAITSLSLGVYINYGNISLPSMLCLAVSIMVAATVPFIRSGSFPRLAGTYRLEWVIIYTCIAVQFIEFILHPFVRKIRFDSGIIPFYEILLIIFSLILLFSLIALYRENSLDKYILPFFVVIQLTVGFLLIINLPKPWVDTLIFQEGAAGYLIQGMNPYAMVFPDIYPPELSSRFYGPGLSANGVLQFGYPYMPLTLLLSLSGFLLGDIRYANLTAMILAAVLLVYSKPGRSGSLAAALLLSTPVFPLILYLSWTESYVLLMLAFVWFCHCRSRRILPYAVGLLLVSKQYMVLVAPLTLLLLPRPWTLRDALSFSWRVIIAGLIVTLPLALWDFQAFMKSAVWLQFHQPFRWDAMSFLVLANPDNPHKWLWLPFAISIAALIGSILAALLQKKVNFPLAVGFVLLLFFAFNKQAFANYYYLVIGSLCCALGAEDF